MTTTAILVEIVIVGMQGLVPLTLMGLAIFGDVWARRLIDFAGGHEAVSTLVFIAACYTLGTFVDRAADCLVFLFNPEVRLMQYRWIRRRAEVAHRDTRMEVLFREGKAGEFLEHVRSRIRLARATALNVPLSTAALVFWLASRPQGISLGAAGLVVACGVIATMLCVLSLAVLQVTYSKRLKQVPVGRIDVTA